MTTTTHAGQFTYYGHDVYLDGMRVGDWGYETTPTGAVHRLDVVIAGKSLTIRRANLPAFL